MKKLKEIKRDIEIIINELGNKVLKVSTTKRKANVDMSNFRRACDIKRLIEAIEKTEKEDEENTNKTDKDANSKEN